MPLIWKGVENPYRVNFFTVLQIGPAVSRRIIPEVAHQILGALDAGKTIWIRKLKLGNTEQPPPSTDEPDTKEFRQIESREISEASSRLIEEAIWAEEVLLVHPVLNLESGELRKTCAALLQQATPAGIDRDLRLTNPAAMAPLTPALSAADIPLPKWEEFNLPAPGSLEDRPLDIQFDS
jgi:hypothetical protein